MKITRTSCEVTDIPLTRPYTIAFETYDQVRIAIVEIETTDGVAYGTASPAVAITGETIEACRGALEDGLDWLLGLDVRQSLGRITADLRKRLPRTPAARAAVDVAVHDLFARSRNRPLVDVLGRRHDALPTSITIGIKDEEGEVLDEADEYIGRGFTSLKVKIGLDVDGDIDRLHLLRDHVGPDIGIRVDANQGYNPHQAQHFLDATSSLDLELVEQPLSTELLRDCRRLRPTTNICLDESVHDAVHAKAAFEEPAAGGSANIKLMKCGGIAEALSIAKAAHDAGRRLMWGCMDESRLSIAAALHAAFACPATRWLDLDGHLDLAADPFDGGFELVDGMMTTLDRPGLGVSPASS